MEMWEKGLEYMQEIFSVYFQNIGFVVLVIILVFLFQLQIRTRENARIIRICGIIWFLFLNPFVISIICSLKGAVTGRYVRVFWLFPFTIAIAWIGVRLLERKKIIYKIIILTGIGCVLLATGGTILNSVYYTISTNPYKIDSEVIEVADKIEACKKEEWAYPYVLANVYLSTYLRQYDGNIRQLYGREPVNGNGSELYGELYYYADKEIPYDELYEIGCDARNKGINMIVFAKHQIQSQALESVGYQRVDETEGYYIYRYEN